MDQARRSITSPLRAATYETLIGLLAASGLRIGEAIKLDRGDVDWSEGVLLIRESKFGKSRLVPLHASSMQALARLCRSARRAAAATDGAELLRLPDPQPAVATPSCLPDVPPARRRRRYRRRRAARRPGCTTCRHTFAVRTLLGWYRAGEDVQAKIPSLSTYLGHREPGSTYWYLSAAPELLAPGRRPPGRLPGWRSRHDPDRADPAGVLHRPARQQRQASPRTIAAYRDTLRLLLGFVHQQTGKPPAPLDWDDLDATTISAFLNHLETERHNSARTRNVRLTAIRSLFSYAALRHPEHALLIQRVLAIPPKRFDKRIVTFLTAAEIDALIAAPDQSRWEGRRDRALMLLAIQTGLRVSELIGLNCGDVTLGTGANVRCEGKGRKAARRSPHQPRRGVCIRAWLTERAGRPADPLFPTRTGRRLSRDAVALRVSTHAATAAQRCPSLQGKRVHPHVLRHSCAMSLLQAGVDTSVIALWLGHAGVRSTDAYLHADITIKEKSPRPHHARVSPARPLPAARQGPRVPREPVTMPRTRAAQLTRRRKPTHGPPPRHSRGVGIGRPGSPDRCVGGFDVLSRRCCRPSPCGRGSRRGRRRRGSLTLYPASTAA